jgi:hypothetical protein
LRLVVRLFLKLFGGGLGALLLELLDVETDSDLESLGEGPLSSNETPPRRLLVPEGVREWRLKLVASVHEILLCFDSIEGDVEVVDVLSASSPPEWSECSCAS